MKPANPRVIVPASSWRQTAVAVGCGLLVLVFVIYGIATMNSKQTGNVLSGRIVEMKFTPHATEQQISYGSKGLHSDVVKGEYLLKVEVKVENGARTYDVPVDEAIFSSVKKGDSFSFERPKSEQQ